MTEKRRSQNRVSHLRSGGGLLVAWASGLAVVTTAAALGYASGVALLLAIWPGPGLSGLSPASADRETVPDRETAAAVWPALFGTPLMAEPAPAPLQPRLAAAGWALRGMVVLPDGNGWAVLAAQGQAAGSGGDLLLRRGDQLPDGTVVERIGSDGVLLSGPAGQSLAAFPDSRALPQAVTQATLDSPDFAEALDSAGIDTETAFEVLQQAGTWQQSRSADGVSGQQILSVRRGGLFDRIGLREGDLVVSINGVGAGNGADLLAAAAAVRQSGTLVLDVMRAGQHSTIEVVLDGRL